ncbi:MAG: DUF3854 domain-containing protein [Candidatus Omnitrophota bacterium]
MNKRNPCPVCGKKDWCMISSDGKTAVCARIESPREFGGAGWLHQLDKPLPAAPVPPPAANLVRAAPDTLNAVYTGFLSLLTLSGPHRENLRARGLTDKQISELGYKTMPGSGRRELVGRLISLGYKLAGVPGFYYEGQWRLAGPGGILIPVRDYFRRIKGLQIRTDNVTAGSKYIWLSSSKYNGGSSPGPPFFHVAWPAGYEYGDGDDIWITEGPLKGDIAAAKIFRLFLAVTGVSNWYSVIPFLHDLSPKPSRVVIAFDMDKNKADRDHRFVRLYLNRLTEKLLQLGFRTFEADWNADYKGIDDLCLKKKQSQISR